MYYPFTRHLQRYEYITRSGHISDKVVVDLGCGVCVGTCIFTELATFVFAVDNQVDTGKVFSIDGQARLGRLHVIRGNLFQFTARVDVATAIEVFEHISPPERLIDHMASICTHAFLTTPLAKKTAPTVNPEHVAEYSAKDFDRIIGKRFKILEKVYQHADMHISETAKPSGCSFDVEHVVQMVWCKRK